VTSTPDELVAAARRSAHTRTAQVIPGPIEGSVRVYLPTYGRHFDAPAASWPMPGAALVAHAQELARRGEHEQAGAAADHALTLALDAPTRDMARRVHLDGHAHRCCTTHGTHAATHRGCLLR